MRETASRHARPGALAVAALTVALAACGGLRPPVASPPPGDTAVSPEAWAGTYRDLSDWELTLELAGDGGAQIRTRWWGPSGSSLRRIAASWTLEHGALAIHYGDVTDHLRLDRAPGPDDGEPRRRLTSLAPIHPRSLIGLTTLWGEPDAS